MVRVNIPEQPLPPKPRATDLVVPPWKIIIDTREQSPWTFHGIVIGNSELLPQREIATLTTGDYSIKGHEFSFVIERKSGDDLLGSLGGGHDRFRREHERMAAIVEAGGFAAVVVEDSLDRLCAELDDPNSIRKLRSESILGVVASWPQKFRVQWTFAGSRRLAEILAIRMMVKFMEKRSIRC